MSSMTKRYAGDPFSQALAFLFEQTSDKKALQAKLSKEMTPLAVKVALKVGEISSEEMIVKKVLPVFTGTISLYLVSATYGVNDVAKWADLISRSTLESLFRQGFTMIHRLTEVKTFVLEIENAHDKMMEYVFHPPRRGKVKEELLIADLCFYSTQTDEKTGDWSGYVEYIQEVAGFRKRELAVNFMLWLVQQPTIRVEIETVHRGGDMGNPFETESLDTDRLIARALINGSFRGSLSTRLNYQKLIAYTTEAAGLGKAWFEKRDRNYQRFLLMLPEQFRQALLVGDLLSFYQNLFKDTVSQAIRRKNGKKLLDILFYNLNGSSLKLAIISQGNFDKEKKQSREEEKAEKKDKRRRLKKLARVRAFNKKTGREFLVAVS